MLMTLISILIIFALAEGILFSEKLHSIITQRNAQQKNEKINAPSN